MPTLTISRRPLMAARHLSTRLLEALFSDNRKAKFWILSRDAIEELAPVGAMRSSEAVMGEHGPEPQHEAADLIRGIQAIMAERRG